MIYVFPPEMLFNLPSVAFRILIGGGSDCTTRKLKKFTCEDQADRKESEVNCIILTNFAALDTIKKLKSFTELPAITV